MSATPTHSTFSQPTASRRISFPRSPGPMMPMRMRSLAPSALDAASPPARLVATLLMKNRRDCMESYSFNPGRARVDKNDYILRLAVAGFERVHRVRDINVGTSLEGRNLPLI